MSECRGDDCTHPDCADRSTDTDALRKQVETAMYGYSPEKWALMNRAQRREAMRGKR